MYLYHLCFEVFLPVLHTPSTPKFAFPHSQEPYAAGSLPPAFPTDIFDRLLPSYRIGTVNKFNKSSKIKLKKESQLPKGGGKAFCENHSELGPDASSGSGAKSPSEGPCHRRRTRQFPSAGHSVADWRIGTLTIEWYDMFDGATNKGAGASAGEPRTPKASQPTREGGGSSTLITETAAVTRADTESAATRNNELPGCSRTEFLEEDHALPSRRQRTRSAKKKQKAHTIPTSGAFIPFRTGTTELNAGILHLYRERADVEDILHQSAIPLQSDPSTERLTPEEMSSVKGTGTILCVLAVPSYMTAQDFLNFVGPLRDEMSHLRIVRDSLPNRYMVLIKFRDAQGAERFYKDYNGREFSSLEPEMCHVVYIKSIEFKSRAIPPYAFPPLPDDPSTLFLPTKVPLSPANAEVSASPNSGSPSSTYNIPSDVAEAGEPRTSPYATSPAKSPTLMTTNQLLELPTCPVCLERMDASVTGLLTILCHHTFHCHCLSKWGDSSCPVCRYSSKVSSSLDSDDDMRNECMDCGSTENLWICLICGNIGCGRYQEAHAQNHFADTQHTYSMELETQRVWDYAGDGYVHRLIQNRTDGKLVELPAPNRTHSSEFGENLNGSGGGRAEVGGMVTTEKMESIGLEYTYLLTSQLESQRLWYESRLTQIETALTQQSSELTGALSQMQAERDSAVKSRDDLQAQLTRAERDNRALHSRLTKILDRVVSSEKDLKEERALTKSLLANQTLYQTKIASAEQTVREKDADIADLKEQVRDLMVFLDMRKQVEDSGVGEVKGAQVVGVAPAPPTPGPKRKGKGKK
ncbi:uncharacterized protein SPPG_03188 [Spizellomyces punctatus DAOM BR117]|uniref:BRCA1-associated protein n=1 Tax=Spizellomyces punctatus (strain DAOM BR117) TaxID=645134 RepID=A0A0L0HIU0_SPIPD|nr:uncharacterized protein SPPG_03188 [Spizellomyces punctatus DAOM BR117]KND01376.1 hypothetical protein SPPG_03188 [Spizellomyces punctatus DAOM BR117]|eukprot:XP_016609415.1 hypothetical protein SPPG_03188 [Spizellomyces punctatus DAOM BR117]